MSVASQKRTLYKFEHHNFIDPIRFATLRSPAYAGMTTNAYDWRDKKRKNGRHTHAGGYPLPRRDKRIIVCDALDSLLHGNDGKGMVGRKKQLFVTPAQAGVGLYSVGVASQIPLLRRGGVRQHDGEGSLKNIVNFIDPIPAFAGMTKHAFAGMTKAEERPGAWGHSPKARFSTGMTKRNKNNTSP